jgi:hypothetical protein
MMKWVAATTILFAAGIGTAVFSTRPRRPTAAQEAADESVLRAFDRLTPRQQEALKREFRDRAPERRRRKWKSLLRAVDGLLRAIKDLLKD